jgi:peptide/nickel transport system permease protein
MFYFILRRASEVLLSVLLVSFLVFAMMVAAPGDPAMMLMGQAAARSENQATLERLRREMGLNKPVYVQYGLWLGKVVRGDLGVSFRSGRPVAELITGRLPATLQLLFVSVLVSLLISVPLAVVAALTASSWLDRLTIFFSVGGVAIPGFWLGLILILVFSVQLGWLPPSGYTPILEDPLDNLKRSAMPVATLSVYLIATFTRFLRGDLIEVLRQDYIRTAAAKGLGRSALLWRHALRNALPSLWTVVGIETGTLLGGAIIVEVVFGWSGIGWLAVQAVINNDYAIVQGVVLFVAIGFALITLLTDIGYAWLDPRLREAS